MLITRLNSNGLAVDVREGVELPEVDDEQRAEADQAEADDAHAHHGAAAERDRERRRQAGAGGRRGAHVGAGGHPHAEVAGQAEHTAPGDERHADQPGGGVTGGGREHAGDDEHEDREHLVLGGQEGHGAAEDLLGDLLHAHGAGILLGDPGGREQRVKQRQRPADGHGVE
jgi:hypothetical protein